MKLCSLSSGLLTEPLPYFIRRQFALYSACLHPADAIAVPLRLLDELLAFELLTAFVTLHLIRTSLEKR